MNVPISSKPAGAINPDLLHGEERKVWSDAGHQGQGDSVTALGTVSVALLTLTGPETLNVTASPELEVSESAIGFTPQTTGVDGGVKAVICESYFTVRLTEALAVA
jgi:hypothetical protein